MKSFVNYKPQIVFGAGGAGSRGGGIRPTGFADQASRMANSQRANGSRQMPGFNLENEKEIPSVARRTPTRDQTPIDVGNATRTGTRDPGTSRGPSLSGTGSATGSSFGGSTGSSMGSSRGPTLPSVSTPPSATQNPTGYTQRPQPQKQPGGTRLDLSGIGGIATPRPRGETTEGVPRQLVETRPVPGFPKGGGQQPNKPIREFGVPRPDGRPSVPQRDPEFVRRAEPVMVDPANPIAPPDRVDTTVQKEIARNSTFNPQMTNAERLGRGMPLRPVPGGGKGGSGPMPRPITPPRPIPRPTPRPITPRPMPRPILPFGGKGGGGPRPPYNGPTY